MFQDAIAIGLVFSVLFQETFRFLIYLLLDKADAYLKKLTETEETQIFANKHILAYVVGLVRLYLSSFKNVHCHCQGFGLMSGAFSLVNVLAASLGPGTLGFNGEPHNFFIVSSIMTLCMILLNTAWGVIFFSSLDTKTYWQTGYVVATHMFVSCLSLLNSQKSGTYYPATIIPTFLVLILTTALALKLAGASVSSFKTAIMSSGRSENLPVNAEE